MKPVPAFERRFLAALTGAALVMTCLNTESFAQESPKVVVAGVSVNRSLPLGDQGLPMGRMEGVEVVICVQVEDQHIIAVADDQKKLPRIATDSGKKLAEDESWSTFGTQINDDGHAAWIPVKSADVPPSGTTTLKLAGEIALVVGSEPAESTHEFALEPGTKGKLGKADVEIEDVSKNDFGDGGVVVTFTSKSKEFTLIQKIKFLAADGSEIESSSMGSTSFGFGDEVTSTRSFSLAGEPTKVKVNVSYFGKTSELKVPVDAEATLGLGD